MIQSIRYWFESRAFGVCTWWGERLGIKTTRIRMYFIYLSFFTFGSPIIFYFIMAFRSIIGKKRPSVWDL